MTQLVNMSLDELVTAFSQNYFKAVFGTPNFFMIDTNEPLDEDEEYDIKDRARKQGLMITYNVYLPNGDQLNFSEKGEKLGVIPRSVIEGDFH
jgi:hypothetical protein